jgi:hypothetical protein
MKRLGLRNFFSFETLTLVWRSPKEAPKGDPAVPAGPERLDIARWFTAISSALLEDSVLVTLIGSACSCG